MMRLVKADMKKIIYLSGYRLFILLTFLFSILLGLLFLFTIDITQGKQLAELTGMEVMDVTLLGIDVAAIMLIVFSAQFVAKMFSTGSIQTFLTLTPRRNNFFLSKLLSLASVTLFCSLAITMLIFAADQLIISFLTLEPLPLFDTFLFSQLLSTIAMPVFYALLSAAAAFYTQNAAGGITFSLGVMFLPALINMFPEELADAVLPLFPQDAFHVLSSWNNGAGQGSVWASIFILILWLVIPGGLALWRFRRSDF